MTPQLRIADQFTTEPASEAGAQRFDQEIETSTLYEDATKPDWGTFSRRSGAFIKGLLTEIGKDQVLNDEVHHFGQLAELRLVDQLDESSTDDVDLGTLFALPDESLLFVGKDPTAKDAPPHFGFVIEPFEPVPAPTSAQEALDLLRPGAVRDAFADGDEPGRQGEWWLLPTMEVPVGRRYTPGVNERPFGPSPLGNHVPREWGMTAPETEFVAGVRELTDLPESVETPPEFIEWLHRQYRRVPTPDDVPEWDAVQDLAGDILVRGTLRHRENDHYIEDLGNQWHRAETHGMDVYTADDVGRVVLD